ncbi:MAG: bifunctional folylpolyglutamate synthase/dihydrofolate synthase [Cyclobacteriaceae bacterium]|nr:bifunctional folylpolyglutamate synthase/dihydrofolate synthase [Cyclobacteriaceae bacterium SS2]
MNYEESLDYLLERLPMFQRVGKAAIKKDLGNTLTLLKALGDPHKEFKSIHIAGTNGKGTSAHALTSVLKESGYKTGLYTSPHLKSFTERIRINGNEVSKQFVADFVTTNQVLIDQVKPSFFEVTVVMAFEYFRQEQVDIAVIETGLGGRLDSTNVIHPLLSLITMIGYDHMDLLGDTLDKIAVEKAGIIKENAPVVIGNNQQEITHVFEEVARSKGTEIHVCDDYQVIPVEKNLHHYTYNVFKKGQLLFQNLSTDITSTYFSYNIPGVLKTLELLDLGPMKIDQGAITRGFKLIKPSTGLKGRLQVIGESPMIIADISHNQPGLITLFEQLKQETKGKLHVVFGVVRDKDLAGIFPILPQEASFYWTSSNVPRSLPADELKIVAENHGIDGPAFQNVNHAIEEVRKLASKEDTIVICGSTFVVAEIDDL